nr:MAG TPA: hypothetical protein [Caudoviricetes sp.]
MTSFGYDLLSEPRGRESAWNENLSRHPGHLLRWPLEVRSHCSGRQCL